MDRDEWQKQREDERDRESLREAATCINCGAPAPAPAPGYEASLCEACD